MSLKIRFYNFYSTGQNLDGFYRCYRSCCKIEFNEFYRSLEVLLCLNVENILLALMARNGRWIVM